MEILADKAAWAAHYRANWHAEAQTTGRANWKVYQHPRNELAPGAPGVDLAVSRLLFITSAGAYLPGVQEPFDAASLFGDHTMRTFPSNTPLEALAYAHDHYDHQYIAADPQAALPLGHLAELVAAGRIGALTPSVISFMGYQPDSAGMVDELVPPVVAQAKEEHAQAALLAPV